MSIDELINLVTKDINNDWSTLYKIRYVYLELGKYLSKDTDFFFSVDNKLNKYNMNFSEIKNTYESKTGSNNKVICHSAAQILKTIYDYLGIKSRLVKQINKPIIINKDNNQLTIDHYFLAVEDGNSTYFMTLASDLPFIKEGMKTRLFANDIPYKRTLSNKTEEQVYEGEEIKHTVLSDEDLKKIDKEIGYINNYYRFDDDDHKRNDYYLQYNDSALLLLKEEIKNNKWYNELLAQNTVFYKSLYNYVNKDNKSLSFNNSTLKDFSDTDINDWINTLCLNVEKRISNINGQEYDLFYHIDNFNYDEWLKNICNKIHYIDDFTYTKWSKEIKSLYKYNEYDYNSVFAILDKTNAIVKKIKNRDTKNFNNLLIKLSYHFIEKNRIININNKSEFVSNKYIAYKLAILFPKIFGCNDAITPFNQREYSEQIVIIKEILEIMFPELNKKNSKIENYNNLYSSVFNRIQIYTIKSKKTQEYSIIFNVVGNNIEGNYYYYYNPKENKFYIADILEIFQEYVIVSERLVNIFDDYSNEGQKKR